jgi:hypothetical protein
VDRRDGKSHVSDFRVFFDAWFGLMWEGTQRVVLCEVQPNVRHVDIACEQHAEQNVFAATMLFHPLFLHPSEKTDASLAGEYEASKVVSDYFNLASSARLRLSRATVLL